MRYRTCRVPDEDPRARLRALAAEQRRFSYPLADRLWLAIAERRRLHVLLRAEGCLIHLKKTQRLYRE